MIENRRVICLVLILTAGFMVSNPSLHAVTGERSVVVNPGFEDPSCSAWTNTGTIGGGTVKLCDPSKPYTGFYSAVLNATKPAAGTMPSKDAVRAVVQQAFVIDSNSPGVDSLSSGGFSMWWYVDPSSPFGMVGLYSIHFSVSFSDTSTGSQYSIEYWYGVSDLANVTGGHSLAYRVGDLQVGRWFQTTRDLTADIRGLNIANPAATKINSAWFGAFGNTTYGEHVYLDDVALNILDHPIPLFSASPLAGPAPLTVSFDGTVSMETSGNSGVSIANYSWSFGDGSPYMTGNRITHTYNNPGDYTAVLTVTDSNGQSRSVSSRISVGIGNIWLGPAIAGGIGVVFVGGWLLLRPHGKRAKNRSSKR